MKPQRKYTVLKHLLEYEDLPPDTNMSEVTELLKLKVISVEEAEADFVFHLTNKGLMELGE